MDEIVVTEKGAVPDKGNTVRIVVLGDVVGRPGRKAVQEILRPLKENFKIDLAVVNGENAAGGAGIDMGTAMDLKASGADVITLGDHAFQRKGAAELLDRNPEWIIRPHNHPEGTPGKGYCIWRRADGLGVLVMNLIGRVFMGGSAACPFRGLDECLAQAKSQGVPVTVCDLHAEATSEKWAMARYGDGRLSLLFGTHTHVQTADAQVLAGGTAYLTDVGMCGSRAGVIGMDKDVALKRFLSPLPAPYEVSEGLPGIRGLVTDIDPATGKAVWIRLLQVDLS